MHPPSGTPIPRNPRSTIPNSCRGVYRKHYEETAGSHPTTLPHQPPGACATRRSSNSGVLVAPLLPRPARQSLFFFWASFGVSRSGETLRSSMGVAVPPPTGERYVAALLRRKMLPPSCGHAGYHPHPARDVAAFSSHCSFRRIR
ncbi:hypothetical protein CGRA01v4_06848 [Colletotrichum graminicola]|nr:hypothetical protein CGRA01v4_06848 [Colletotrichum graminicola]